MALDTHALAQSYKRVGFTDEQVEAMVEAARQTAGLPDTSQLTTKGDLATLKSELLIWNVGAMFVVSGFMTTILFFALKH